MVFLAVALLSFIPVVEADDDTSTASVTPMGFRLGYVCYDDGCSPTDQVDWWKVMLTVETL